MKDPAFRYFMERKMAGGSSEPNLHILPPKAYEKWLQSTQQVLLSLFRAGKDEFESSKTSGLPSGDKRGDRQQQEVLDRTTLQADLTQVGCREVTADTSASLPVRMDYHVDSFLKKKGRL